MSIKDLLEALVIKGVIKKCVCGEWFFVVRSDKVYCSRKCKNGINNGRRRLLG